MTVVLDEVIEKQIDQEYRGEEGSTLTGTFRMIRDFSSSYLEHARDVLIWLPPDYSTNLERRYPVLYMNDGQNLFDAKTAFGGNEWHVDETATDMVQKGEVEPLIIVGVYNTGQHRVDEYTPTLDKKREFGGKGEWYGRFLIEELKPYVDAKFRTLPSAPHTGLAGSSLGGLITLYIGLRYPHVFGRLGVMSPSIWWDRRMVLRIVRALKQSTHQRIWLDAGTDEGKTTTQNAHDLRDLLIERGWKEGEELTYIEVDDAGHNEAAWAARFGAVLGYLFPKAKG